MSFVIKIKYGVGGGAPAQSAGLLGSLQSLSVLPISCIGSADKLLQVVAVGGADDIDAAGAVGRR